MLIWVQPGGNPPTGPADPCQGELRVCPRGLGSLLWVGKPWDMRLALLLLSVQQVRSSSEQEKRGELSTERSQ